MIDYCRRDDDLFYFRQLTVEKLAKELALGTITKTKPNSYEAIRLTHLSDDIELIKKALDEKEPVIIKKRRLVNNFFGSK